MKKILVCPCNKCVTYHPVYTPAWAPKTVSNHCRLFGVLDCLPPQCHILSQMKLESKMLMVVSNTNPGMTVSKTRATDVMVMTIIASAPIRSSSAKVTRQQQQTVTVNP